MSSPELKNYTPIDVYGFRKKHLFSTVEKGGKKTSRAIPGTNILLVASIVAFLLSISYYVQNTLLATNSRASEDISVQKPAYFPQKTLISSIQTLPKGYSGEETPAELISDIQSNYGPLDTKNKKNFVFDKVIRFYIYRDILKENSLPSPAVPTKFDEIVNQVPEMEKTITENILSKKEKYSTLDDIIKERIGKFN